MAGALISWLIVPAIAGGIASLIVPWRTPARTILAIVARIISAFVIGVLGSILGGLLLSLLIGGGAPPRSIGSLVVCIIGAATIRYTLRAVSGRTTG